MIVRKVVLFCCLACVTAAYIIPHRRELMLSGHPIKPRSASDVTAITSNSDDVSDGLHRNHTQNGEHETNESSHESHGIHVASWNYEYVEQPFIIAVFLLIAGICKLGFHHADFLSSIVPESCLLIILGVLVGLILHLSEEDKVFPVYMTPRLFFLFLLPPIILESAYSLHDRVFFDNVGTVLLFAVIGTILNCFIIGPLLYLLADIGAMGDIHITLVQCLVFSSLVVAVDPVAVLAIFQEVGVNNVLYFLVFGESLLNDAVTVVLYNTMKEINVMGEIPATQVVLAIAAFFTVSLGGLFVGLLFGVFTAVITKYTVNVRVVEPLAIFVLAYMSYLVAEMFHFSGIISIIGCGLTQANYAFHNVSQKSNTTVKYFSKMLSSTSDCVIFLFLGMTLFRSQLIWHTGFILWTLVVCLVVRFTIVFVLTFIANKVNRLKKIDLEEQFIMAYGGLRGAVCFSLVDMLDPDALAHRDLFVTTTLAVVFFTVFVQGISIKPLVKCLRIQLKEQKTFSIYDEINVHVTDHVMAGIEEVLGRKGQYFWREILEHYDDKYLRNYLQRTPSKTDERIMEMYEKMLLRQHFENLSSSKFPDQYASSLFLMDGGEDSRSVSSEEIDTSENQTGEFGKSFDGDTLTEEEMEKYAKAREEGRRRSRACSIIPAIIAADKRRESRALIRQDTIGDVIWEYDGDKQPASKIIANPTAKDIRKMLAKNPSQLLHQDRADKNLKGEDSADIVQLLHRKQAQTRRMSHNIGNNYDGIFQGALLQSRLRELSPWKTAKFSSFDETSPKIQRDRAQSSFTPEDAARARQAAKKRSQFTRSATVGDQQTMAEFDTDDRSPLLQRTRHKAGSSSSVGKADSNKSLRLSGEHIDKEPVDTKYSELKGRRDRATKWRQGRSKRAQTFDVAEPLLEETLPDAAEGQSVIPLSAITEETRPKNGIPNRSDVDPEGRKSSPSKSEQTNNGSQEATKPLPLTDPSVAKHSITDPQSETPIVTAKSGQNRDGLEPSTSSNQDLLHVNVIPRNPSYVKAVSFDNIDGNSGR